MEGCRWWTQNIGVGDFQKYAVPESSSHNGGKESHLMSMQPTTQKFLLYRKLFSAAT